MVFHYPIWVLALVLGLVAVALKKMVESRRLVSGLSALQDSDFTNLFSGKKANEIVLALDPNQTVHDTFLGARVSWTNAHANSCRTFVLKIRKKDKRRILRPYLQHIHSVFDEFEQRKREVSLYMNGADGRWRSVPFSHPSTLETIAMDSDLKNRVKSDLESFLKSKQYYHRLGRVWKRSFLLYGPSGTGKIELCRCNGKVPLLRRVRRRFIESLRRLRSETASVADEKQVGDCGGRPRPIRGRQNDDAELLRRSQFHGWAIEFLLRRRESHGFHDEHQRPHRSSHVETRKSRSPHLLPSLPISNAFKTLANSYLGVKDHKLFPQLEEIFQSGATLSPAEIGEIMIVNRSSPSRALKSVITALQINGDSRSPAKIGQRSADKPPRPVEEAGDQGGGFLCRESVHHSERVPETVRLLEVEEQQKIWIVRFRFKPK
ncbi:AAA-ATPase [Vitis vinifera]|uniref:AAA-ATPase n=1 Tax=Vitis vinifera TaxID=29760 RepID=A0A438IFI7_VITVI|nr:AAA-ATPase [Vitis vinifera]